MITRITNLDIQQDIDKVLQKILLALTEVSVIILTSALSIIASVVGFFLRRKIYPILSWLGLNYFEERNKMIRDINSDLIWCQGALKANSYGLFRSHNGQAYVLANDDLPHITSPKRLKSDLKIKVHKINSKPEEFFPKELDYKLFKAIINTTVANDWKLITYESISNEYPKSEILLFLEANGIDSLLSYKIWDMDKKTFGIIFFSWSSSPNIDLLFDRVVSKKLDSISIRFQNYIVSSIVEKIFNWRVIK